MNLGKPDSVSQSPTEDNVHLPTLSEFLSSLVGFKIGIPAIKMPQTLKNFDVAVGMIVAATGENLHRRISENTKSISAKGDVQRKIIKAGGETALEKIKEDPKLMERAIDYATNDLLRKQENREAILKLTAADFAESQEESGEPISEDWLVQCIEFAEKKSEPDVQAIWAKIIAGEIRNPGRFPLRFLAFFSTIDHALALKISTILSYTINDTFIYYPSGGNVNERGDPALTFDAILEMEEAGILTGTAGIYGEYLKDHSRPESDESMILELRFIGRPPLLYRLPRNEEMIGGYPISQMARKLLSIIKPNPPPETYIKEINSWGESHDWTRL